MGHDRPDATHRLRWHVMPERPVPQQDSLRIVPANMASWDDIPMDGEPAGWVAVEPRTAYPRLQRKRLVWKDRPWGELFVGKDTVLAEAGFRDVTHPTPRRSVMRVDFA